MEYIFWTLVLGFIGFWIIYRLLVRLDVIHEHEPAKGIGFNGASLTSKCKCGKRILQDSQGGWS